ncbi:hypothetical protein [Microcoleus sp. Pol12B5]|uniref:hypothetical protein n=1 Tax=Microcoleus sp. Pol12B5 TaxID=3055396 RepID=UPI002FD5D740
MSNLARFDQNGIELVINTVTGAAYATQSGYARMSGLSQQAINKRCKGYNQSELESAEADLGHGLQGYNLIPAKLVYRWLVKDNPELSLAMGEAGATVYLHQLAGFKVRTSAITPAAPALPQTYVEALKALVQAEEEKEQLALENSMQAAQIDELEEDVDHLFELVDELFYYSSIVRIAKLNNVNEKNYSWRKLKAASKIKAVEVKQAPCQRFGVKNLYHSDAWKLAYPEAKLPAASNLAVL